MNPVDILLTTYNNLEFLQDVISIFQQRTFRRYQFIIVDRGSKDGSKEWLLARQKMFPDIFKKVFCLGTDIGEEAAKATGMEFIENDLYVEANDSCLCPSLEIDWLTQLETLITKHKDYSEIALRPQKVLGVGPIFQADREVVESKIIGDAIKIVNRKKEGKTGYAKNLYCYDLKIKGSCRPKTLEPIMKYNE